MGGWEIEGVADMRVRGWWWLGDHGWGNHGCGNHEGGVEGEGAGSCGWGAEPGSAVA